MTDTPSGKVPASPLWRRVLPAALVLAAVVRCAFWFAYAGDTSVIVRGDTLSYWSPGATLVTKGAFSVSDVPPFVPDLLRTPVYPIFLGILSEYARLGARGIAACQVLLSLAVIVALAFLIRRPLGGRAASAAALLLALDLPTAVYANFLMSEVLFSVILVGSAALFVAMVRRPRPNLALALGLLAGVLALCRPVAAFYAVPVAGCLLFLPCSRRVRVVCVCVFLVSAFVLPAAWIARNVLHSGRPMLSTISAINLYEYRGAWNAARLSGKTFGEVQAEFREQGRRMKKEEGKSEAEVADFMAGEGLALVLGHPALSALQALQGAARMLGGISKAGIESLDRSSRASGDFQGNLNDPGDLGVGLFRWVFGGRPWWVGLLKIWAFAHLAVVYAGMAILAFHARRFRADGRLLICFGFVTLAYFIVLSAGAEANSRFRVPIAPVLCLLSAAGWASVARPARE